MNGTVHTPPNDVRQVYKWYRKAQIDYTQQYIQMYISYNAWYRQITASTNDREAISLLKKRFIIWDDYCKGRTMPNLNLYMERVAKLTSTSPISNTSMWNGVVVNDKDWRGLIEFWYQVRCRLMHGSEVSPRHVWLAYETLDIFMGEIVDRMQACFTERDFHRLEEVSTLARTEQGKENRFRELQRKLQAKYIDSPDIWQVDMQRVSGY